MAKRATQLYDIQINSSHSDTFGSLSIQNKITQTDSTLKHAPTSEDISNQVMISIQTKAKCLLWDRNPNTYNLILKRPQNDLDLEMT